MKLSDFVEIELRTDPPTEEGYYCLTTNTWWAVTEEGKGLLYRGYSRQCNKHLSIVARFVDMENHPARKAVFLPKVWESIDPHKEFSS
jgi:hypothetical protein